MSFAYAYRGTCMKGNDRRVELLQRLQCTEEPITGGELAKIFGVTRQIIVKDIGLLKAEGADIVSTAKGYCLKKMPEPWKRRSIRVCHKAYEIEEELQIIVDLGGRVLRTEIDHPAYGVLGERLFIRSRKDIQLFLEKVKSGGCEPLLFLTNGIHTHIIEAEDENTLDEICENLKTAGYLKT